MSATLLRPSREMAIAGLARSYNGIIDPQNVEPRMPRQPIHSSHSPAAIGPY